jgi:molybdate transport system substrate-binding protein
MAAHGAVTAVVVLTFAQYAGSQQPPLRVLVSNGVKPVIEVVQKQAERTAGRPLAMEFNTTTANRQKILAGEPFDVAIFTSEAVEDLVKQGKLAANARAELARTGIGVGVRMGAAKPDLRSADALKRAFVAAKSITYAQDGASRPYLEKLFEKFGIASQMQAKTTLVQGSGAATQLVAQGKVDLVLTLVSEILPVQGIELAGPFPADSQNYVSFAAAASANTRNMDAAKALVQYLSSAAVAPVYKAKGLDPR